MSYISGLWLPIIVYCLINQLHIVSSWNTEEMEVFDIVEEIKENFYTVLGVPNTATLTEIKKSFRKLSVILHPDHNDSPKATEEFRRLVSIFDVLKNPNKRKYYDDVLVNGLPNWKNALYYYRRVRKMGLQEMFLILAAIISVGQYLVAWASYLEQKFTIREVLKSKDKKFMKLKKNRNEMSYSDEYIKLVIDKPSVKNTLPFQIFTCTKNLMVWFCVSSVAWVGKLFSATVKSVEHTRSSRTIIVKPHKNKPKRVNKIPELVKTLSPIHQDETNCSKNIEEEETHHPVISGGLWTDDDIIELIKLVKKYPAGELQRWNKIAMCMKRSVAEVTYMANKIKTNDFRMPVHCDEETQYISVEESKKMKTKGGKLGVKLNEMHEEFKNSIWTQEQQKAFETALNKYCKKSVDDKWLKISNCVPGKTKEECILRYKTITEMIKTQQQINYPTTTENNIDNCE